MRGGGNIASTSKMRRCASDQFLKGKVLSSAGSSPGSSIRGSDNDSEEFVEVTLDLQDDDTIVLRSVEPATSAAAAADPVSESASTSVSARSNTNSRSPAIRRTSSYKLLQFSQELKAEAVARAKQFSQDLKAEIKKLSRTHSQDAGPSSASGSGIESALAARAARRQRAQLDRTKSGAHKALRGLRFISGSRANSWAEVQRNFDQLSKDGYLSRSDFAQCIGEMIRKFLYFW
jgi:respiratory burst oxidase